MEENLDELIQKVFNTIINHEISSIGSGCFYYNINGVEIALYLTIRSDKNLTKNKFNKVEDFIGNYIWYTGEYVVNSQNSSNSLLDFHIRIDATSYCVPRPDLTTYAKWISILNDNIKNYQLKTLNKIIE